jgi:PAS domain S-box-containing protein
VSEAAATRREWQDLADPRQLFELIDQPVLWARISADGSVRIADLNPAACDWLGCRAGEAVGRELGAVCPSGWGPQWVEQHRIAARAGASICWAAPAQPQPASAQAPAQIRLLALPDGAGGQLIASVVRHLPRSVLEQGDLRRTTQLLQAIVDQQPECVKLLDGDGTLVHMNRAGLAMLGVEDVATVNRIGLVNFIHAEDRERFARFHRAVCAGESGRLQFRLVSRDGRVWHIESAATPLRDPLSGRIRHLAITRDQTASVLAEQALARSEDRLEWVLRTAGIGIWTLDLKTWQATRSLEHDRCFGYRELCPEWSQQIFLQHLHPEDRSRAEQAMARVISHGEELDHEFRVIWPDGSLHWIWGRAVAEYDNGVAARLAGIVVDISSRKAIEQALVELNSGLERRVAERTAQLDLSNQELRAFTYSVSHDLRAPLRGILGWSDALDEDAGPALDALARSHLVRIRQEARRMSDLVEGLLRLARIAQSELDVGEVDVSTLAQEIVARLRAEAGNDAVAADIAPGMRVRADRPLLDLALANLLQNAFKFCAPCTDALIRVSARTEGAETVIEVHDNGVGFDPQRAGELFQPFARLHSPGIFTGTGIGLATVDRIMRRHGGRAEAKSAPGQGASFNLRFPGGA